MADTRIIRGKDDPASALSKLLERHKGALDKALAANMKADRLIRIATNALHRTPALQNCSLPSIVNSVVLCGVMGLEPNTPLQHAYLIPYGKECTFQPGYRGLMHLARRTARIGRWRAEVVREDDEFDVEYGIQEKFSHKPTGVSEDWVCCYSFALDGNSDPTFILMSRSQVEHIRDTRSISYQRGRATSPWTTDFEEMAKKTVIKRHCKSLDLSIEVSMATTADDQAETEGKQESFIEAEFRELAEQAEDANQSVAAGSSQEQEQTAERKIVDLGGSKPAPPQQSKPADGPPADLQDLDEWPDAPEGMWFKIKGVVYKFDEESGSYREWTAPTPPAPKGSAFAGIGRKVK